MAVLIGLWLVPAVAFGVTAALSKWTLHDSVRSSEPAVITVGSRDDVARRAVKAEFSLEEQPTAVSSARGTVTSIEVKIGDQLSSGVLLARVDDSPVVAFAESEPLYRDIGFGDSGRDVEALRHFLATVGHETGDTAGSQVSRRYVAAISAYQLDLGIPATGVFAASTTAFLKKPTTVDSIESHVGDVVSSPWIVIRGRALPVSLRFRPEAEGPSLTALEGPPLTLRYGSVVAPLRGLSTSNQEIQDLYLALAARPSSVAEESLDTQSQSVRTFDGVTLERMKPVVRAIVPSQALLSGPQGIFCLAVSGNEEKQRSRHVRVVRVTQVETAPDEPGLTFVARGKVGTRIVRDPSSLPIEVQRECR
jgi:hypothetical protein